MLLSHNATTLYVYPLGDRLIETSPLLYHLRYIKTHVFSCVFDSMLFSFSFKVYTDPWIVCPIDRVEELEPNKSTVVLGYKWQLPRTNMKNVTVSPSNYDENYPFPVGRHRVTWIGTSDSGTLKSCSFHITVNGKLMGEKNLRSSCPLHEFKCYSPLCVPGTSEGLSSSFRHQYVWSRLGNKVPHLEAEL